MSTSGANVEVAQIETYVSNAAALLEELQHRRQRRIIALVALDYPLIPEVAQGFNQVLRRMDEVDRLDLFLESLGGDVDSAAKIARLCLNYTKDFQVLVPFYAKSAASLLALYGRALVMTKAAELGPVDPQVRVPGKDMWIPAHSMDEAVQFISEVSEPIVKAALAEKLDPWIIGAYRNAQAVSRQYLDEALQHHEHAEKSQVIEVFTKQLRSHGYPIDRERCRQLGLNVEYPDPDTEELLEDLQETYSELLTQLPGQAFIVQARSGYYLQIGQRVFKRFETGQQGALTETGVLQAAVSRE